MWFVVGLGNPGPKYQGTRHNAGFLVVDRLAQRWGISTLRLHGDALVGSSSIAHADTAGADTAVADTAHAAVELTLVKPQTFMNRSGGPTAAVLASHGGTAAQTLVVHDDLDLPFGTIRVKRGGGHGGHNGLRDLHLHLGGPDYPRVRFGVGRPPEGQAVPEFVLSAFSDSERSELDAVLDRAVDAVQAVLMGGLTDAMNTFNIRASKAPTPVEAEPTSERTFTSTLAIAARGAL